MNYLIEWHDKRLLPSRTKDQLSADTRSNSALPPQATCRLRFTSQASKGSGLNFSEFVSLSVLLLLLVFNTILQKVWNWPEEKYTI